jgi:hypothetical protein
MKKSYFLFLLLLFSVLGSVSAETIVLPDTCTLTEYYIVVDAYSEELIVNTLNGTDWDVYAPEISGISGNTVYLSSQKDLARILCPLDDRATTYATVFPSGLMGTSEDITVYKGYLIEGGSTTYNNQYTYITFTDDTIYQSYTLLWRYIYNGVAFGDFYINDVLEGPVLSGSMSYEEFGFNVLPANSELRYQLIEHSDWGTHVYGCTVVFGNSNAEITGTYADTHFYTTHYEGQSFAIDVYTEPETVVYEGLTLLGTTDNEGFLEIQLAIGEHDLTFVKDGYYNLTQTVEFGDASTLTVDMEPIHLDIPVSIIDSEGGLTSVNLYIDGELTGTVGNNQDVSLSKGTHELVFEKSGYWNETRTVTVDETLTDLSIRMYPESVFFKISNTPSVIQTYSNSEVNIALNIDPNDYAYGVKLYLTGQEVLDVRDSSNVQISKQDSYYLLDDFSSAKTVNVKINSGTTLGTNSLAVRVTGYNSIGTEFVTDTTIDYEIVRLPLSLTVPNWCIGSNSLTVIETEGDSRTVTIKVEDSESNIIYTDTYTLEGFETHKFNIDFEETGDYKLYIQSGDLINTYIDVTVANPVTLETKTITASAGSTTSATVSIENPYTEPQYYRITIEGDPLTNATRVDFSISPGSSKSQSISFTLLDELDYDSYSLPLKVYLVEESGMTEIYSDSVILNIGSSGSFIPFIDFGDDGIIDTVITLVVDHPIIPGIIIIGGLGVFIFSGKKKGKKTVKKPVFKKGGKKGGK